MNLALPVREVENLQCTVECRNS